MSKIIANIKQINSVDSLNIVSFDFSGISLKMMSLELKSQIKVGSKVLLTAKPTSIAIGKGFSGEISYSNQIPATISSIELGELLCNIKLSILDITLESIITVDSAKRLNLQVGDSVTAFIKASELSILEVIDD